MMMNRLGYCKVFESGFNEFCQSVGICCLLGLRIFFNGDLEAELAAMEASSNEEGKMERERVDLKFAAML